MTEQERKLKVEKVEKYNELIDAEKAIANRAFMLGTVGLALGANFVAAGYVEEATVRAILDIIVGSGSITVGTTSIYFMAQALSKKTMFEGKVEKLNEELNDEQKSRGSR